MCAGNRSQDRLRPFPAGLGNAAAGYDRARNDNVPWAQARQQPPGHADADKAAHAVFGMAMQLLPVLAGALAINHLDTGALRDRASNPNPAAATTGLMSNIAFILSPLRRSA